MVTKLDYTLNAAEAKLQQAQQLLSQFKYAMDQAEDLIADAGMESAFVTVGQIKADTAYIREAITELLAKGL